jgi:NADPH:quinone reductase-like Zn-dependent oxidoreductase
MKAVYYEKFGPPEVLELREVEKPVPGNDEVLIKVHAAAVNAAECNMRGFVFIPPGLGLMARLMLGFKKPKINILGSALAGEIVGVGKDVQTFKIGDQVFGGGPEFGAYAAYACRPEGGALALKPRNMSYEEAVTIPYGALTAYYFLHDKADIRSGHKVLVHGASGDVGAFAVQLAHYFGAEVTGVCSTANLELVNSLGAHTIIDYTKEDFTQSGKTWDIIFDVVVGKTSFTRCRNSLTPKGYYLAVAGGLNEMLHMLWTSIAGGRKVIFGGGTACEKKENLVFLKELIEAGKLRAIIDKIFPLEQIVEAHRYVDKGHKKGNVVVTIP